MKNNFVSYYELLGMIKEGNIPEIVYWINRENEKVEYKSIYDSVDNKFVGYILQHRNMETENIRFYLSECMMESSFFDKCIEIPDDDFEDISEWGKGALEEIKTKRNYKIEKLQKYICILMQTQNQLINNQKKIIQKLKEKK